MDTDTKSNLSESVAREINSCRASNWLANAIHDRFFADYKQLALTPKNLHEFLDEQHDRAAQYPSTYALHERLRELAPRPNRIRARVVELLDRPEYKDAELAKDLRSWFLNEEELTPKTLREFCDTVKIGPLFGPSSSDLLRELRELAEELAEEQRMAKSWTSEPSTHRLFAGPPQINAQRQRALNEAAWTFIEFWSEHGMGKLSDEGLVLVRPMIEEVIERYEELTCESTND